LATIEAIIGARVARLRRDQGMTQAQLGQALEPYTGLAWSRANVSNAEAGARAWTASDVLAVCMTLRISPSVLFMPLPDQLGDVQTAGNRVIASDEIRDVLALPNMAALSGELATHVATEVGRLRDEVSRLAEIITPLLGASAESNEREG
jgi:hypothetical protein